MCAGTVGREVVSHFLQVEFSQYPVLFHYLFDKVYHFFLVHDVCFYRLLIATYRGVTGYPTDFATHGTTENMIFGMAYSVCFSIRGSMPSSFRNW